MDGAYHSAGGPSFADRRKRDVVRRFFDLSGSFWTGQNRVRAWALTIGLAVGLLAVLGVNVSVNRWQSFLFNALEKRDAANAWFALWLVPLLALGGAAAGALVVYTRETLQVFWREWVVARLTERWISNDRYHHIQTAGIEPANPEYRIADDVRIALDPIVDFAIGFFSATLAAVTFIGILWTVGGSMRIGDVTVPAFMVLAAIAYGAVLTTATLWVGQPLVGAVARRNEAEAKLRFELTRVREHAATVARAGGGPAALRSIASVYADLVARWRRVVGMHTRLTWFMNGHGVLAPIFGIAVATPKYLAGDLSLGDVVSLGAAFVQVQAAFSWIVDNYRQIALCYASVGRVVDLVEVTGSDDPTLKAPITVSVARTI